MNAKLLPGFALVLLATLGCGSSNEPEQRAQRPAPTPETFTVAGTFSLDVPGDAIDVHTMATNKDDLYDPNSSCNGRGGYTDLADGAQVVIRNASGDQVALGELTDSRVNLSEDTTLAYGCVFQFSVADVPDSGDIYSIEVSHRGEVSFKKAEASSLALSIS